MLTDWINLAAVQAETRRLTAVGAALISFLVVSKMAEWILGPGDLANFVKYVDDGVVGIVVLFYACKLVYELYLEVKGKGNVNVLGA